MGLSVSSAHAQRDLAAGLGAQSLVIDLDAATGETDSLGIQHLNGEIFVTTRVPPPISGLHFVTVFDGIGNKLRDWHQPGFAQASEWGFRDGASDGSNLFFGYDFGIQIMDVDGNPQDGSNGPNIQSANGPQTVPGDLINGNVLAPENAGITRALAFDRYGNGGEGSFWTGNFGSSIFEIDIQGDILRSYPNAGEVSYGFGIDPVSRATPSSPPTRMWINSAPNEGNLAEYDLSTGTLTGKVLSEALGSQGGLDIVPGTLGRGPNASGYDILQLRQADPDIARLQRLHLDVAGEGNPPSPVTRLGTREPDLLASVDDEAFSLRSDAGLVSYPQAVPDCNGPALSTTLNIYTDISRNPGDGQGVGGLNGTPAVIFANLGPDAAVGLDASSNLIGIRELAHLQPLLTNPLPIFAPRSRGVVLSNDPMLPNAGEWRTFLPAGQQVQPIGGCIRFQALYLDTDVAFLPLALTNQIRLCRGPTPTAICGTFVQVRGPNSFNADTSSGFFQITNGETDPPLSIVRLRLGIPPGPAGSPATQALLDSFFRFDTDNTGMADLFEGGDSLVPGCRGTYRNGSEIATGLIFSSGNKTPRHATMSPGRVGSACRLLHLRSTGTISSSSSLSARALSRTGKGSSSMWIRTAASGSSATDMAGLIVEVQFNDGTVRSTEIIADPFILNRAIGQL